MSIFRESIIPRACLIQGAREIVDSENLYVINGIGGINSNNDLISSYLPDKSEILDNNSNLTAYHRTDDQKNTAAEVKSTAEGTAQSQRMQSTNSGYMFSGKGNDKTVANEKNRWEFDSTLGDGSNRGKPNDGYPDYSFASRWTEIQSKVEPTIDVPVAMPTAEQQTEMSRQFGNSRTNGDEQSIYGMPFQVLGGKSPIELNDNGFLDQASGDPSPHSSQYTFGVNLVDQSARQAMASGGTSYGGMGQSWDEYVTQNSTGTGFTADIAERESFVKMPLPSYLGYGVKDNYELIAEIEKQHKDKIEFCLKVVKNAVPGIVLNLAREGIKFLPPAISGCALAVIIMVDICLAANEAYDQWDADVRAYEQKYECSREVAEENVRFLKEGLDAFMSFSMAKWTKYVLDSVEISADFVIEIVMAVLRSISEEKLKEWGRTIRDWRRENVDPYLLSW